MLWVVGLWVLRLLVGLLVAELRVVLPKYKHKIKNTLFGFCIDICVSLSLVVLVVGLLVAELQVAPPKYKHKKKKNIICILY